MKFILPIIVLSLFTSFAAEAQTPVFTPVRRTIRYNYITKDSVNLALNEDFELIEDSCSQITRYAHLNRQKRTFFGRFKDVSRSNPDLVLAQGNYNTDGLKDGDFITYFSNGKLQAKGSFKNGLYDGNWSMYYDDGRPRLTFEAAGNDIKITDAWDEKGNKTVTNGKGTYRSDEGTIYWKGKLLNGKPDGTWRAIKTDDATNTDLETESYKNGSFQQGNGPAGDYSDAPRLVLVGTSLLPFTKVEKLRISAVPCNGVKRKHIVNAQYGNGFADFSEQIKRVVSPYLAKVDLQSFDNELSIEGYVSDSGGITNLNGEGAFNPDIARGLTIQLRGLPRLVPATVDGKPVKQKIVFKFVFTKGMYSFNYRFLPVDTK
jgi:hypothetical protein